MKLKKFKEKDGKRTGIIVFTITCILLVSGVILYRTFAIFEVRTNQNVIKGTVQDPGNLYFAFYQMNEESREYEIQKEMPKKESEYVLDEEASYCGINGSNETDIKVTLTEDYRVIVSGMTTSRTKCNLYFVKGKFIQGKGIPIVEEGDGLYEVSHEDYNGEGVGWKTTELRFSGKDPKNYIEFNGELWRVIGLVNVKTSEGTIEQRLKIIRDDSIGNFSWDHKPSSTGSSTSEYGSNDWTDSQLMEMLNGIYYNSEKGICWKNGENDVSFSTECNFDGTVDSEGNGLKKVQNLIDENIIWNLGRTGLYQNDSDGLTKHWYNYERGTTTYEKMDTIWKKENTKNSTGIEQPDLFHSIGLIYPSDYGYATSGGTKGREYCLTKALYFWGTETGSDNEAHTQCANNDWIYKDNVNMHTLISYISGIQNYWIRNGGQIIGYNVRYTANIYPTLYLKQNVKILNDEQDGSSEKPYHLQQIL